MEVFKAQVALQRIKKFLDEPEVQKEFTTVPESNTFGFEKAQLCYTFDANSFNSAATETDLLLSDTGAPEEKGFTLRNMDVTFPINALSIVMGPTGSGKSSLLLALLGGKYKLT